MLFRKYKKNDMVLLMMHSILNLQSKTYSFYENGRNKNQIWAHWGIKLSLVLIFLSLDEVDGRCYTRRGFKEEILRWHSRLKNIKKKFCIMFSISKKLWISLMKL